MSEPGTYRQATSLPLDESVEIKTFPALRTTLQPNIHRKLPKVNLPGVDAKLTAFLFMPSDPLRYIKDGRRKSRLVSFTFNRSSYETLDAALHIRHTPRTRNSREPTTTKTHKTFNPRNSIEVQFSLCKRELSPARRALEDIQRESAFQIIQKGIYLPWDLNFKINTLSATCYVLNSKIIRSF
jgi:hypothetical protein